MALFTTYIYVTYEMASKSKEVETKDSEKRSSLKMKKKKNPFFVRKRKVIITEFSKAHSFLAVEMRNNSNFWDDLRVLIWPDLNKSWEITPFQKRGTSAGYVEKRYSAF